VKDQRKRKKKKVILYRKYSAAKMEEGRVYVLERDIDAEEKEIMKKFENGLNKRNLKFIKKKVGKYYRYWIVINFFM
jgi:hypothetical protein